MKASTANLQDLIKNRHTIKAVPKLIAEWEHNRFTPIKSIAAFPSQDNADEDWENIYNLDSITLPNRPRSGAAKARFDANGKLRATSKYRTNPAASRFYLATEDDPYKYWSSIQTTNPVGAVRYSNTSTVVSQINAATNLSGLQTALNTFATAYGFNIKVATTPGPIGGGGTVSYAGLTAADVQQAKEHAVIFVQEMSKYPQSFVTATGINTYYITGAISGSPGGQGGAPWPNMYLSALTYNNSIQDHARQIIHHEFAHMFHHGPFYDRGTWNVNNPSTFVYLGFNNFNQPFTGDHPEGFVSAYARATEFEDLAELHRYLMTDSLRPLVLRWAQTDPYLAGKINALQKILTKYHYGVGTPEFYEKGILGQAPGAPSADYPFATPIELTLLYDAPALSNKIVVGFETSYASPKQFTILVTENGTTWNNVASNVPIPPSGQVVLWHSGGAWGSAPSFGQPLLLRGIRVVVSSMNLPYSHLDVIQMGLRLENDLSDFVMEYSKGFEVSDRSVVAPMGQASSNVGSITLSNIDHRFNNDNDQSLYRGLIGKKVRFTLDLSFDATPTGGQADERVRELTMWSDEWTGQDEEVSTVSLKDSSVILQETPVPKVFWQDFTIGSIVWQLMDMVGMSNYRYSNAIIESGQVLPYFWPKEDDTLWEQVSEMAKATQTAIYFDEFDVMQIKTRRAMYGPNRTPSWGLDAVQNGIKLPDIESLGEDETLVVNKVDVIYKPTKYSDFNNGLPKMETVWEPEEDSVVLRATGLTRDLRKADTSLWISHLDAAFWPYESLVNIRGEVLRYKGKEYTWHRPGGTKESKFIYSLEEKQKLDEDSDPNLMWANTWTGRLSVVERGVAGSGISDHIVKPSQYSGVVSSWDNRVFYPVPSGTGMHYGSGTMTLKPPRSNMGEEEIFMVKHEATILGTDTTYGTRFRFPENQQLANGWSTGGLLIANDFGDVGYYFEISTTDTIDALVGRHRRNEISVYSMPPNAPVYGRALPSNLEGGILGATVNIVRGKWYDLDVRYTIQGSSAVLTVFIDGVYIGAWTASGSLKISDHGKFGVFTRGQCSMEFEHLYAVKHSGAPASQPDTSTFLDLVRGGFVSGYIEREWRYGSYITTNRGPAHSGTYLFKQLNTRADYVLDEFGPVVHEIRQFNVKFDEDSVPVSHSYPYISNSSQAVILDYRAGPFDASFTIANATRQNAILNGDDSLTFGEDNTINQKMFVYGRALYQEDDVTVTREDKQSIRRNGVITLTFNNRYVQTKEMAEQISDWVLEQWSAGSDEIEVKIFGNPLLQLGDLVTINYPVKDMSPETHKYYIVNIDSRFDSGFDSTLTLRRAF